MPSAALSSQVYGKSIFQQQKLSAWSRFYEAREYQDPVQANARSCAIQPLCKSVFQQKNAHCNLHFYAYVILFFKIFFNDDDLFVVW